MAIDPNKPVYPLENPRLLEDGSLFKQHPGMTLREHFAGLAMQGFCAAPLEQKNVPADVIVGMIAKGSVMVADALIAELAKGAE